MSGVQIWTAHLEAFSPGELEELSALLDAGEQARAARFHFERDRRHYVASRGLLRRLLGAALDTPASRWLSSMARMANRPSPAPLQRDRTLCFNLSHSAGWAMFALAWDCEVGIDLESPTGSNAMLMAWPGSPHVCFPRGNWRSGRRLPETAREAAFLRAWTRKEAYAKATGHGLFDELIHTDVALDAAAPKSSLTLRSLRERWTSRVTGSCTTCRPLTGLPRLSRSSRNCQSAPNERRERFRDRRLPLPSTWAGACARSGVCHYSACIRISRPGFSILPSDQVRYLVGFWFTAGLVLSLFVHTGMLIRRADAKDPGYKRNPDLLEAESIARKPATATTPPETAAVRY